MTTIANLKKHFLKLCTDEEADVQWCDVPSKALALSGELEFILTPHITSEIACGRNARAGSHQEP